MAFVGPKLNLNWQRINDMMLFMIFFMVSLMTVFGLVVSHLPFAFSVYYLLLVRSLSMSLTASFLVAGPVSWKLLIYFRQRVNARSASCFTIF